LATLAIISQILFSSFSNLALWLGDICNLCLQKKLTLQLLLLLFSQKTQFRHNFIVVFKTTFLDNVSCFPVSFRLGNFVVFFSHVHVSGGISCVFFTAVVEALKLFFKLFGTSSDMFFSLVFSICHFHIVTAYNFIYLVKLFSIFICRHVRLGHALRNIWFVRIMANCLLLNRDFANFRILIFLNLPITAVA
jgi:hypothetical protein